MPQLVLCLTITIHNNQPLKYMIPSCTCNTDVSESSTKFKMLTAIFSKKNTDKIYAFSLISIHVYVLIYMYTLYVTYFCSSEIPASCDI